MSTVKIFGNNGVISYPQTVISLFSLLLFAAAFSASVEAACVDGTGLNPVQLYDAATRQQLAIVEKVVSKQLDKGVVAALQECRKQKHAAGLEIGGDARIWMRTAAAGNKQTQAQLQEHVQSMEESSAGLLKQTLLLRGKLSAADIRTITDNLDPRFPVKKLENPEKVLMGSWYLLKKHPTEDRQIIASELRFIDKEFVLINPQLVSPTGRYENYRAGPGQMEVMEWRIKSVRGQIPFRMSMGMTLPELQGFFYFRIELTLREEGRRNTKRRKDIHFLLNPESGELLLASPFNRDRNPTHVFDRFISQGKLPAQGRENPEKWAQTRQHSLNVNKSKISSRCDKTYNESFDPPYCRKILRVIDGISVAVKKRVLTPEQKKARTIVSEFVLQPIHDYSDSTPVPTKLPYESIRNATCKAEKDAWYEKHEASGYANTLWALSVQLRKSEAAPGDDKAEFARFGKAIVMWNAGKATLDGKPIFSYSVRQLVHLREDGVFGLGWNPSYTAKEEAEMVGVKDDKPVTRTILAFDPGKETTRMYYDPANRWEYKDKRVNLYWQNDKQPHVIGSGVDRGGGITTQYVVVTGSMVADSTTLASFITTLLYLEGREAWNTPGYRELAKAVEAERVAGNTDECQGASRDTAAPEPEAPKKSQPGSAGKSVPAQPPVRQQGVTSSTKSSKAKPAAPKKKSGRALVGCWKWSNGAYIVVDANGRVQNGAIAATWKAKDAASGRYTITWPSFIDTLSLSADGDTLTGASNYGFPVSATRKTGKGPDLEGDWLWSNGITVNIRSNANLCYTV